MKRLIVIIVLTFSFCVESFSQSSVTELMTQALSELENNNLQKAQNLYSDAMRILESNSQQKTKEYATCLHNIARCCMGQKKNAEGKNYCKKALDLRKELLGELDDDYILSLNNYAIYFGQEDDYKTAWKYQSKAIELCEKLNHKHPKEFLIYDNMARFCVLANDANNCLKYWEVALSHVEKYGKDYENILKMLDLVVAKDLITDSKVMEKAVQLIEDFNEQQANSGNISPDDMPDAAEWYATNGNLDKAREIYSKLLKMDLSPEQKKKAESSYAMFCSTFLKDSQSAAEHYLVASDVELNMNGKTEVYNNYVYMAYLCYKLARNRTMAENCRLRAANYIDNKDKEYAAKSKSDTQSIEQMAEEHLKYNLSYLRIRGNYIGMWESATTIGSICSSYKDKGDYDKAVEYAEQYVEKLRNALRSQFRTLDYEKRKGLWKSEKFNIENIIELFAIVDDASLHNRMTAIMYDLQLMCKGFLLNSAISFSNVIEMSGDANLKNDYESIIKLEEQLTELRTKITDKSNQDAILQKSASLEDLQLSVCQRCAEYADYTDYMSYTWKDVQRKLGKDDVAIEFVLAGGPEELISLDKNMHALVLTKDMAQPVNVTLAKMIEFRKSDKELGKILWEPLSEYLKGKKRVYFSADDMFNCMGIEYYNYGTSIMSEQFEMYRLSSTKVLCTQQKQKGKANVVLVGGIDYGNMAEVMNEDIHKQLERLRGFRESADGFENLPFALQEIEQLNGIYKNNKPMLLKDKQATEQAFRLLDNKKVTMLHISTHGSYMSYKYATDSDAMENSILALSGANIGSLDADNDGIISAADIASMNLRYCDMAILSACQTGLGKQGDDGVFGLMRGFKNAGVRSLLLTLASVYDQSTSMLMEQFHKLLATGKYTKLQALTAAQKHLREHGYNDPKYWAAFILLDAID